MFTTANYRYKVSPYIETAFFVFFLFFFKINFEVTFFRVLKIILFAIFATYTFMKYNKTVQLKPLSINGIILFFLLYCVISLFYSDNVVYGAEKLLNILFIIYFLGWLGNILIKRSNSVQIFFLPVVTIGLVLVAIVAIHGPFDYNHAQNSQFISHVGFGRYVSFAFIVSVLYQYKEKFNFFWTLSSAVLFWGVLISGLRSAIFAIFCFLVYFSIKCILKGEFKGISIYSTIAAIILGTSFFFLLGDFSSVVLKRCYNATSIFSNNLEKDGSIEARQQALVFAKAMILEKPFWGHGLGGFKQFYRDSNIPFTLEYPHNFFIETIVELGFLGLFLILILLVKTFIVLLQLDLNIFFLFLNSIILGLFSGSIADQTPLFLIVAISLNHTKLFPKN